MPFLQTVPYTHDTVRAVAVMFPKAGRSEEKMVENLYQSRSPPIQLNADFEKLKTLIHPTEITSPSCVYRYNKDEDEFLVLAPATSQLTKFAIVIFFFFYLHCHVKCSGACFFSYDVLRGRNTLTSSRLTGPL